ncbi:helix-turn-helix transcriptional regulator [Sphingobium sp.]|uniref:helix-turn-helix transcriptional regulator n=1 Tax=Sphingobium sp. TaxID=1912891 RepID=UPI0035C66D2B
MAVSSDLWTVQASSSSQLANVQLRRYHYPTPNEVIEEEARPILSLTYPQRQANDGRGRFLKECGDWLDLGRVILRPPNIPMHAYGAGGIFTCLICEYDADAFERLTKLSDWDMKRLRKCTDIRTAPIGRMLRRIGQEVEHPGMGTELIVDLLLQALLVDLGRLFASTEVEEGAAKRGGLAGWQLRRIRDLLHDSVGVWPSIQMLADACQLSRSHLSRSFREATGTTLVEYSTAIRMIRAKALLAAKDMSIGDVAMQIGFGSLSSFSNAFRRETGYNPTEFAALENPDKVASSVG